MPLRLQHYVSATKRKHPKIKQEIKTAYQTLGSASVAWLDNEIVDWSEKPKFMVKVTVTNRRWELLVKYDGRTSAGKKFDWVDIGTGLRGPHKQSYPIRAKKAKALRFIVPFDPPAKTPASGPTNQLPPGVYITKSIESHPGIWPRNFTQRLRDRLNQRNKPGGFKSVTEAAVKRGLRKR